MPTVNPNSTQRQPYKLHPALIALFAGLSILEAVLYGELPPDQPIDPVRLRKDTRRDVQDVLDYLRHE